MGIRRILRFLGRQPRDWKVTVIRACVDRFAYQIVFPYQSVYTVALGATGTYLGIVNTVGMATAGILSPFTGWLIDRLGNKTIYLFGIILVALSYFTYSVARSWTMVIYAMLAYWLGQIVSGHSCATVCANSLANKDRATGMSFCETFALGAMGIVAPMFGAFMISNLGGMTIRGIRPLFFISLGAILITFLLVLAQLSNRKWREETEESHGFLRDLADLFRQRSNLKRWLVISSLGSLPLGMVFPFTQVFAHTVKGADQYVLAAMVTGSAVIPLVFGIPLGRLADRIGRKKVIYLTAPLFCISNLILVLANSSALLVAAGVLQGFFYTTAVVSGAMGFELVPSHQMGRWLGIMRFFRLLFAAAVAYMAGVIWDRIGPQYVFLIAMGVDMSIRIPLLIGMPETLHIGTRNKDEAMELAIH